MRETRSASPGDGGVDAPVLTARAQHNLVKELVLDFAQGGGPARPVALITAQHLAIVSLLRSIGNVLNEVDADSPARSQWLAERWPQWKAEPIFAEFINPTRNRLLKKFAGALKTENPAFAGIAAVASADGATLHGFLDVNALREADGTRTLDRFREALDYWDRHLREAEAAFGQG